MVFSLSEMFSRESPFSGRARPLDLTRYYNGQCSAMKQLIVNADDFGITRGITDGIVEGHRRGMITSATIMANMPAFAYAAHVARSYPSLGIGLHLNLIDGPPVSPDPLPGLVNARGSFWGSVGALIKQLCLRRVRVTTL